ncbi:MAG: glutathione S-transferase N-terminal domain-containing protein [Methylotenera sp.]|nr:glutathione S-transferase N-terminal domain-containing protein [Oligoflexia bacterium]
MESSASQTQSLEHSTLNVAFYKFVELSDLRELQASVKETALQLSLKGSVLLSQEGVNAFIAGEPAQVRAFLKFLGEMPFFKNIPVKESWTHHLPFKRMLVKIKKEIITMGEPDIHPALKSGDRISALELKKWLDEKKDVVLLDTRNDYEIEHGTFGGALDLGLKTFKEFPKKLEGVTQDIKDKPVVMFCTGGIRCEKATALALKHGFTDVYQLEGGILKYFEEVGGAHYKGECFVFDGRVAVDMNLSGAVDRQTREKVSEVTLHSYRRCPFAIRVRMVLEEKNIPHKIIEEDLGALSAELLSKHPQGRVPLLIHNGLVIYESSIITEYLDEQFTEPKLMPPTPEVRARVRLWTHWCNEIFKPDLDRFKYEFKDLDEAGKTALVTKMHDHLRKLEKPLRRNRYLIGKEFSLADIHVFPFFRQLTRVQPGLPNIDIHERLHQWLASVMERPSFERVMEKNKKTELGIELQGDGASAPV